MKLFNKLCSKCKKDKSIKDFYKDKSEKSRYKSWCKECNNKSVNLWRSKNKSKHNKYSKDRRNNILDTWRKYFPISIRCPLCNKKIYFASGVQKNSICFDHNNNINSKIKDPGIWLRIHRRTSENELLFEKENFGMLCSGCNRYLPTYQRKETELKRILYIFGEQNIIVTKSRIIIQYSANNN
jgi:hypothetical protein